MAKLVVTLRLARAMIMTPGSSFVGLALMFQGLRLADIFTGT